jgi:hypothetical protein
MAQALPPAFLPRTVALSYEVEECDRLIALHFDGHAVVGFGARAKRHSFVFAHAQLHAAADAANPPAPDIEWRPTFKAGQPQNPVALIQARRNACTHALAHRHCSSLRHPLRYPAPRPACWCPSPTCARCRRACER